MLEGLKLTNVRSGFVCVPNLMFPFFLMVFLDVGEAGGKEGRKNERKKDREGENKEERWI